MQLNVQVEKMSSIQRKLTIRVPATEVAHRFNSGLAEVQKSAKLKGFRPGQAPISIIKQHYGEDVRHQIYHSLIDESFQIAVREQKIRAVGRPQIETAAEHKHGEGEHDHGVREDQDLTYVATVEIMPEIQVKGYTGLSLKRPAADVTDEQVQKVVEGLRDSQAELVPASGGLAMADGSMGSRPARMGDHVDLSFDGGIVTESGTVEKRDGMKGTQVIELGSNSLIPGFEEQVVGMRNGDDKTFRIRFPKDYGEASIADKEAEFSVHVNEVKEKKMPELNDEFAKSAGYEGLADLKSKAREFLTREATENADRKVRSDLLSALIEKNPFDVPTSLVEAQTRALAQDWAQELKSQGVSEDAIQRAVTQEVEALRKRAESQVRASLLLESVAEQEKIDVPQSELEAEIQKVADSMKVEIAKLKEYYAKNPSRIDDLQFRVRQEKVVKFLLDSAKIKA